MSDLHGDPSLPPGWADAMPLATNSADDSAMFRSAYGVARRTSDPFIPAEYVDMALDADGDDDD